MCSRAFVRIHEARLDAAIAKDLKELGQMKTMQAMGLGKRVKTQESLVITQSPSVAEG
jgi:hypothetical protein